MKQPYDFHSFSCPANPGTIGQLKPCNCPANRPNTATEIERHDAMMRNLRGEHRPCATCGGRGWVS